jgi:hypothetical protein
MTVRQQATSPAHICNRMEQPEVDYSIHYAAPRGSAAAS